MNLSPKSVEAKVEDEVAKKRKFEKISFLDKEVNVLYLDGKIQSKNISSVIDTGATISAVSSKFTQGCTIRKEKAIPIKV